MVLAMLVIVCAVGAGVLSTMAMGRTDEWGDRHPILWVLAYGVVTWITLMATAIMTFSLLT